MLSSCIASIWFKLATKCGPWPLALGSLPDGKKRSMSRPIPDAESEQNITGSLALASNMTRTAESTG